MRKHRYDHSGDLLIRTRNNGSFSTRFIGNKRLLIGSRLQRTLKRKALRKRLLRISLVTANIALLVAVIAFVTLGSRAERPKTSALVAQKTSDTTDVASPVDRLTAYDVAANVAQAVKLDEVNAVNNQAQSAHVAVAISTTDTNIAAKPQVVGTALKSWRDIKQYVVADGDTVSTVAQKFGITSDSIRWSNDLRGDTLTTGASIVIPPVDGVVVTIKSGDTPQSLATKYHANVDQITQANDAETSGFVVGRRAIIPGGQIVPVPAIRTAAATYSFSFAPRYGGNGYDYGWCTWYAAMRSGAPGNWGNANTWAYYARLSGWRVSSTPTAGAIFQTPAGWAGHVGIVEQVYPNGTMRISDMNGIAGFGSVGYATVPVTAYPNYITRN